MGNTQSARTFGRRAARLACGFGVCLAAAYLILALVGGGWSPRRDERFAWEPGSVLLFAHRGIPGQAAENSDASLDAALRLGFQGVEVDIRRTKDGHLALFHDRTAERMLGLPGRFDELTLAEVQERGLLLQGRETTQRVPTVRAIFQKYGKSFRFYLDMKEKSFRDAERLVGLIEEFGIEDRTVVASTDPTFVAYIEQRHPRINTALERFDAAQVWLYRLTPRRWKPDFLSGSAEKVTPGHADWLRESQLISSRIVYGVNAANFASVLRLGVTKAIVDYAPGQFIPFDTPAASLPESARAPAAP